MLTSKESHAKRKALAQERKAAKPNADSIARAKKIWERLRIKSAVPLPERKQLATELFDIITGHTKDFVFRHDSSRVVETALKYGTPEQRRSIASDLQGEYRNLAISRYSKHLVGKILVYGDKAIRDMVVPELYGHVRHMIKHPEASWILDDIYRGAATPHQKSILLQEWYGPEFAISSKKGQAVSSPDLATILSTNPSKKGPILRSLHELINSLVQKKTTGFTMLHDAMLQYYLNLQPGGEEFTEFLELLKADEEGNTLKNLAFTESGAHVVCLALAYASAKDRKLILRTFKDVMLLLAYDANGHKILLTAYDVIDDTVLISKLIFPELLGKDPPATGQSTSLLDMISNLNARTSVLYPFCGEAKSVMPKNDLILLQEIHEIRKSTSKKDANVRRKELMAHLSPPLLQFIETNAAALTQTSFGCQFVTEVLLSATGEKGLALEAVAAVAGNQQGANVDFDLPAPGRMLKALVQGGRFNPATKTIDLIDPPLGFHNILYAQIQAEIITWASQGNSFVVVALLEADGFSRRAELEERLRKRRKTLVEAAETIKGSKLILQKLDA